MASASLSRRGLASGSGARSRRSCPTTWRPAGRRSPAAPRGLPPTAATPGLSTLFFNLAGAILILFLVRDRAFTAELIGFAFSIGSVGVLLAALVTTRLTNRLGGGRMLVRPSMGFSVSLLPVAMAPDALLFGAVALSGFLGGFSGVAWNI